MRVQRVSTYYAFVANWQSLLRSIPKIDGSQGLRALIERPFTAAEIHLPCGVACRGNFLGSSEESVNGELWKCIYSIEFLGDTFSETQILVPAKGASFRVYQSVSPLLRRRYSDSTTI